MPRSDRDGAYQRLLKELAACGFTEVEAKIDACGFRDKHICALDIERTTSLIREIRQKYEICCKRLKEALEQERLRRQEFIGAIKNLAEQAESPKNRPNPVFTPQQLAVFRREVAALADASRPS